MRLEDIADLERLTQKPTPTAPKTPKKNLGNLDLPNFSPPPVYATDESTAPLPDEAAIDSNEPHGIEDELVVAADDLQCKIPPFPSLALDLLGFGAVWTAIGWSCSLPFVGHALYFLLMAPITVGALAIVYFLYLLYFRGITRSRLETAFQVLAMHSIIHDCSKFWFNGFPR